MFSLGGSIICCVCESIHKIKDNYRGALVCHTFSHGHLANLRSKEFVEAVKHVRACRQAVANDFDK